MSKKITVLIGNWKSRREDHDYIKTFANSEDALVHWWALANILDKKEAWLGFASNRRLHGQPFPAKLADAIAHRIDELETLQGDLS